MARKLLPPLIILATIFFIFSPTLFVAPNAQGSSPVISDPPPLPTPTSTRPDDRAAELLKAYETEDFTAQAILSG
jgi:hypothetical protein